MTKKKENIENKTCPNLKLEFKTKVPNLGFYKDPNLGNKISPENGKMRESIAKYANFE